MFSFILLFPCYFLFISNCIKILTNIFSFLFTLEFTQETVFQYVQMPFITLCSIHLQNWAFITHLFIHYLTWIDYSLIQLFLSSFFLFVYFLTTHTITSARLHARTRTSARSLTHSNHSLTHYINQPTNQLISPSVSHTSVHHSFNYLNNKKTLVTSLWNITKHGQKQTGTKIML